MTVRFPRLPCLSFFSFFFDGSALFCFRQLPIVQHFNTCTARFDFRAQAPSAVAYSHRALAQIEPRCGPSSRLSGEGQIQMSQLTKLLLHQEVALRYLLNLQATKNFAHDFMNHQSSFAALTPGFSMPSDRSADSFLKDRHRTKTRIQTSTLLKEGCGSFLFQTL